MSVGLRPLWHSRDWMLIPLGALAIVAVVAFAAVQAGWLEPDSGYRPPRFEILLADLSHARADSGPTAGMRFVASIRGTVTEAPPVRAAMVDPRVAPGSNGGLAHEDVARFLRAWPMARLLDPGEGPDVSTLELRPEHFATGGRLILREGCLRIVKQGWNEERLAVPFGLIDLFRDPQGYLAIGAFDGSEETRLRIGEPGGLIQVTPVKDEQLDGVAGLRALCGEAPIVLLQSVKRLPDCSPEYLAAEEERQRPLREAARRQNDAAAACLRERAARPAGPGTPPCPPGLPPPQPPIPVEPIGGGVCRDPGAPIPDTPKAAP